MSFYKTYTDKDSSESQLQIGFICSIKILYNFKVIAQNAEPDKEMEIDLLHDIEQIVENDQVEDAADAVVDQVIAENYRDNDEILVGDVTQLPGVTY